MQVTVYHAGRHYSLDDFEGADIILLRVPDGTQWAQVGALGKCAFVPTGPMTRALYEARDLVMAAHEGRPGFALNGGIGAEYRRIAERVERMTRRGA